VSGKNLLKYGTMALQSLRVD